METRVKVREVVKVGEDKDNIQLVLEQTTLIPRKSDGSLYLGKRVCRILATKDQFTYEEAKAMEGQVFPFASEIVEVPCAEYPFEYTDRETGEIVKTTRNTHWDLKWIK